MRLSCLPLILILTLSATAGAERSATLVVATQSSSEISKSRADFVGDGIGDQEEINRAIRALPMVGGSVMLMEGTYDIRRVTGTLGGVLIDRSLVTLSGQGTATVLRQAPGQNTNVIRIIGSDVGSITIRDLVVDCDRDNNPYGEGDPNVSHARFEYCGIKAYYQEPGGPGGVPNHDITIENCRVLNSRRLGIMLEGSNMKVLNNVLGNAFSDSVEILTGPGEIRGNYAEITGRTHVAIGSDRGNSILMSDNIVHVKKGGYLDIGFRSWSASDRHVISGNVLTVEEGGRCDLAMDIRGEGAAVTGNCIHSASPEAPVGIRVGAGNTVLSGNVFENVRIEVEDQTGSNKPILIRNNILENTRVEHKQGNLITDAVPD